MPRTQHHLQNTSQQLSLLSSSKQGWVHLWLVLSKATRNEGLSWKRRLQLHRQCDLYPSLSLLIMWESKTLLTVSTANRLVLTLQRLYTFTTIRVKVLKNFEPNHACANQAQYHTSEVWFHRDTMRPFQWIPICKCWSLQLQSLRRHSFLHLLHHTSPNTTKRATPTPHIVHLIT